MDVWVIEEGEYEQRGVYGVAESLEAAVESIKRGYGKQYIVRWEPELEHYHGEFERWTLIGHFEAVQHFSIKHTARYDIERYELAKLSPDSPSTS